MSDDLKREAARLAITLDMLGIRHWSDAPYTLVVQRWLDLLAQPSRVVNHLANVLTNHQKVNDPFTDNQGADK